jgi:Mrp family chromosome partitioning ATPase
VLETKKALEQVELDVTAHTARARERLKKAPSAVANITDPAELRMKAAKVLEMYTAAEKAATQIGQESLRLASLQEKREEVRQTLEPLRSWLRDLNLKEAEGSRIKINDGLTAASAQTDTRVRFTALGAMLGLMTAFGIVLLPSVMDRRFRAADETKVANYLGPVLGVLPELPGDLADDEHAAMAAHCVHQTRTILQMRHEGADGQVLAVTSSLAGTGKTSLTMALGVSFATSGSRTLMIDCDLVGGGLSARISRIMRRKIGHLLVRDGLVSEQQLEQALSESRRTGRPLGETCVTLGFTGELDVQRALASQEGEHMGVLEALAGESLQDCVAQTGFPGLSILPLGTASARHCASISPAALRRLVKSARGQFDTVLIDTGPVPGSLEASVVVPEVDGVVLVVSKGEHRPSVARSAEYLRSMNAVPVGVVFNRASVKEVSHNSSTLHRSTAAFGSSSGMGLRIDAEQSRRSSRLGPMAQAVAGCAPPDAEEGTNR